MKNKNLSTWAEEFDLNEISLEASEYNLSQDLLEEACEVLTRSSSRQIKRIKNHKRKRECWQ